MSDDRMAPVEEYLRFAERNPDLQSLDVFIVDVNGNTIGKRVPWTDARKVFESGLPFSACAPLLDCRGRGHDAGGVGGSDGDPDGVALPLAGTLARMPWANAPAAQVMCGMHDFTTRSRLWFDPRVILEDVVKMCRAHNLHPVMACELEFYLISPARGPRGELLLANNPRTGAAPVRPTNLSLDSVEEHSILLADVAAAAQAQRIPLGNAMAEYGINQFEVNLRHVNDPLLAADHAVLLRRLIRGVARAHGAEATFIAKAFKDQPGNGLHVHMSLADESGTNRFGAPGGESLLRHAIAGMQSLMLDSVSLFAPNYNSFRRFLGPYVPNTTAWGNNNRSVAFRIPVASAADRRIEHRVAGADASPHLVVAAILAATLHGIQGELVANDPVDGRPVAGRDPGFPRGIWDSLDRLAASETLARYIPQRYLQAYAQLKRGELGAMLEDISSRELDFYL
jgi:glutamine synthetase